MSSRELVEVTDPLGPGLDVEPGPGGLPVVVRARFGGAFPGLDRGFVVDSDDGTGRSMRALVALPASSFRGCRVEVRWQGVVRDARGPVLFGGIEGGPAPAPDTVRTLAGVGGDAPIGPRHEAERLAFEARRRFRQRRAANRITGGRAWEMPDASLEAARYTTAHARPSYSLRRLPPRYVRALERLLDPDERVLYAVERPAADPGAVWHRAGARDRRAAFLVLTDRQVAWLVDHAQPDRFLSDFGVDATCVPVERLREVGVGVGGGWATVHLETAAGRTEHRLPVELAEEARLFGSLAGRFTPAAGAPLPRRRYADAGGDVDWGRMDAFGEATAVRTLAEVAGGHPLAVLPSPARPGHRRTTAWILDADGIASARPGAVERIGLADVHAVALVLSPLEGRAEVLGRHPLRIDLPAPYVDIAAAFVRALRRRLASTPDAG
jgi:hypothetical protein